MVAGSAVAGSAVQARVGLPAAPSVPPTSTAMIGVPTSTVCPSSTSSPVTVPAYGLGSSTTAFAVSISTMTWPSSIVSPGLTCQETMSASVRPSPTSGSLNSLFMLCSPAQKSNVRSTASRMRSRSGR